MVSAALARQGGARPVAGPQPQPSTALVTAGGCSSRVGVSWVAALLPPLQAQAVRHEAPCLPSLACLNR